MTDLVKALTAYGSREKKKGEGISSTSDFLSFAKDGGYDLGDKNNAKLGETGDDALTDTLSSTLPKFSSTDTILSFVRGNMSFIKDGDGDYDDEEYLSGLVDTLPKSQKTQFKRVFKREGIKNIRTLNERANDYRQRRVAKYYNEPSPYEPSTVENISDTVSRVVEPVVGAVDSFNEGAKVATDGLRNTLDGAGEFASELGDIYTISGKSSDGGNALVQIKENIEFSAEADKAINTYNKLLSIDTADLVANHRDSVIRALEENEGGSARFLRDNQLVHAINQAKSKNIERKETKARKTDELFDLVKPVLDGSVERDIKAFGDNAVMNAVGGKETLIAIGENPGDLAKVIFQQGRDTVETMGATIGGALAGGALSPLGSIAGGATAAAKVEHSNAYAQQLVKDVQKELGKDKDAPITMDRITALFKDSKKIAPILKRADDSAMIRAGTAFISGGLGVATGAVRPVASKLALSLGAVTTELVGGAADKASLGEEFTAKDAVITTLFGALEIGGIVAGVALGKKPFGQGTEQPPDKKPKDSAPSLTRDTVSKDKEDSEIPKPMKKVLDDVKEEGKAKEEAAPVLMLEQSKDYKIPYGMTPAELHSTGLTKKMEVGDDPVQFLQNDKNWQGDMTISKFATDSTLADKVFIDVVNDITTKAVNDKLIRPDNADPALISAYINEVRDKGYKDVKYDGSYPMQALDRTKANTEKFINDSNQKVPEPDVPEYHPSNKLFDTPQQARMRKAQRSALRDESEFRAAFVADTNGRGLEADYVKARKAFYRSMLFKEDDLNTSYVTAAKAYGKKDRFSDRLRGIAREDVPIVSDHLRTGEAGVTSQQLSAVLENTNSPFYKSLEEDLPNVTALLKTAVRNGNPEQVKILLKEIGTQSKGRKLQMEAITTQMFDEPPPLNMKVASDEIASIDSNKTPSFFLGDKKIKTVNTATQARQALSYAHGQQLRERLGEFQDVKQIVVNNNKIAQQVADIVNSGTSSGQVFRDLSEIRYAPLHRALRDLVEERMLFESGKITNKEMNIKNDNHNYSLITRDVDSSNLRLTDPPIKPDPPIDPNLVSKAESDQLARSVNEGVVRNVDDNPTGNSPNNSSGFLTGRKRTDSTEDDSPRTDNVDENPNGSSDNIERTSSIAGANSGGKAQVRKLKDIQRDDVSAVARSQIKRIEAMVADARKKLSIGKLTEEEDLLMNSYLKGEEVEGLSTGQRALGDIMRSHIDSLSNDLVDTLSNTEAIRASIGLESDVAGRIDVIRAHIESYLTRSYKAFEDTDKWLKEVNRTTSPAYKTAVQRAIDDGHADSIAEGKDLVNSMIKHVINSKGDVESFARSVSNDQLFRGQTPTGRANVTGDSILSERVHMPDYVRALLGENELASKNFANTVYRQNRLLSHVRRDNHMAENLIDSGMMTSVKDAPESFSKIGKQSPMYSRFSAFHDVAVEESVLKGMVKTREIEEDSPLLNFLTEGSKLFKAGVLTLNPPSYVTQLFGVVMMIPHLGNILPKSSEIRNSISLLREYKKSTSQLTPTELADPNYYNKSEYVYNTMAKVGVMDSAHVADLEGLMHEASLAGDASFKLDSVLSKLGHVYGTPDRVIKTLHFFSEMDTQIKAVQEDIDAGRLPSDTDVFKTGVTIAADNTANFFPTPQRSFALVKNIRTPKKSKYVAMNLFASQFLTFTFEMPRTMFYSAKYIAENAAGENSVRRASALKMLGGYTALAGGYLAMKSVGDSELSPESNQELVGKFTKGNESFNSHIDEDGNWVFYNTEYLNPYSFMTNGLSTLVNPNLTWGDKAEILGHIGINNAFGGNFIGAGITGFNKDVTGESLGERAPKVIWNVLKESFPLPEAKHLSKMYALSEATPNALNDKRLTNEYLKYIRMNSRLVTPVDVWKTAGGSAAKYYDKKGMRDVLLADKVEANMGDMNDTLNAYIDGQLESIKVIAPKLSRHLHAVKDSVNAGNKKTQAKKPVKIDTNSMFKALGNKSGINKKIWAKALRLVENNQPLTVQNLNLDVMPNTNSSLFKELPASSKKTIERNLKNLKVYRTLNR